MPRHVHIIGAGLAGLSAAVRLSVASAPSSAPSAVPITVYEAAKHAGGRCRSFYDAALNATIDNGTHLLLSGNRDVLDYVDLIGGRVALEMNAGAVFAFHDLSNNAKWSVDLGQNEGRRALLGWMWDKRRHPPGFKSIGFARDLMRLSRGRGKCVADCVDTTSELYRSFWQPMTLAVLNVEPHVGSAELLWSVLRETVLKGGAFAKPVFAPNGLAAALVDPALALLEQHGAQVHFQRRILGLDCKGGRVRAIRFAHAAEVLGDDDAVVLAVPHHNVADVMGDLDLQDKGGADLGVQSILNVHYRVAPDGIPPAPPRLVGLVGGQAQWLLHKGPIVSVTVSGADAWMDKDTDAIAQALWPDVAQALGLAEMPTSYRVIKERRATFCASPQAHRKRLTTHTNIDNLFLAGDWTATGLPATLEGAVKSGRMAAEALLTQSRMINGS